MTSVHAEELLEAERQRTTQRLERLRQDHEGFVAASLDSNADDEHDPEGATIAFERSQVKTRRAAARRRALWDLRTLRRGDSPRPARGPAHGADVRRLRSLGWAGTDHRPWETP